MYSVVIKELPGVVEYLEMRWLLEQYRHQKQAIQQGIIGWWFFKKRKPFQRKNKQVYYFRVSQKYRAFAKYRDGMYVVYEINDHQ